MEKLVLESEHEIVVPLFGAAKSLSTVLSSTEFKDFSRPLSDFPVLFKADLIFKDISRKPSKFKYFPSPCEPSIIYFKGPQVGISQLWNSDPEDCFIFKQTV